MNYEGILEFHGTWRSYQARVLQNVSRYLSDDKIHIVAAPGSGKTMLSKRLATILPPLSFEEAIETTKIHSVAGLLPGKKALVATRPFRSPHHTISRSAQSGRWSEARRASGVSWTKVRPAEIPSPMKM